MSVVESIIVYLPKEAISAKDLSIQVLHFLNSLKEIDKELFSEWYEQGKTKKDAQERKIIVDATYLENIINREWDKKFPELGSTFSFWTGRNNDSENVKLNFSIGKTTSNKHLSNVVGISLPKKKDFQIKKDDKRVEDITVKMKLIWNPLEIKINLEIL